MDPPSITIESAPVQPLVDSCKFKVGSGDNRRANHPDQEVAGFDNGSSRVVCKVTPGWQILDLSFWTALYL